VPVVALGLTCYEATQTTWSGTALWKFALLLGCSLASVAATPRIAYLQGGMTRDFITVWILPTALLLPPFYAMATPVPLYPRRWRRIAAFLLDFLIVVVAVAVLDALLNGLLGGASALFLPVLDAGIAVTYFAGFESSPQQGTPGKQTLGLRVGDAQALEFLVESFDSVICKLGISKFSDARASFGGTLRTSPGAIRWRERSLTRFKASTSIQSSPGACSSGGRGSSGMSGGSVHTA